MTVISEQKDTRSAYISLGIAITVTVLIVVEIIIENFDVLYFLPVGFSHFYFLILSVASFIGLLFSTFVFGIKGPLGILAPLGLLAYNLIQLLLALLATLISSGYSDYWSVELYEPQATGQELYLESPWNNIIYLVSLNTQTKTIDKDGKDYHKGPYILNITLRSKDSIAKELTISNINITSKESNIIFLTDEPQVLEVKELQSGLYGNMTNEANYASDSIDINIRRDKKVTVTVTFHYGNEIKTLEFKFKGLRKRLTGSFV